MSTKEQLIGLLFQIRGATSPLQKLKLVALAWRTLRGLSPRDRLVIAKELGLGGAEHLVEQLGSQGGLSPAALLTAIRRAEEADPEELRELLGGVMDPARRDELLAGALHSAGEWLAEQEGLPPLPEAEQETVFAIGVPEPETSESAAASAAAAGTAAVAAAAAAAAAAPGAATGAAAGTGTAAAAGTGTAAGTGAGTAAATAAGASPRTQGQLRDPRTPGQRQGQRQGQGQRRRQWQGRRQRQERRRTPRPQDPRTPGPLNQWCPAAPSRGLSRRRTSCVG